jgi:hypothetical protein
LAEWIWLQKARNQFFAGIFVFMPVKRASGWAAAHPSSWELSKFSGDQQA